MEKKAVVEVGVTPSVHSGKKSDTIVDGEAVCSDETSKKASIDILENKESE